MRIRAVPVDWEALPAEIIPFVSESQSFVTSGNEYEVHAISVYKHVVFFLIVDDLRTPSFVPSSIFEILSTEMPPDWMCGVIKKSGVDLVVGPEFLARDLEAYGAMIDMESDSVEKFWSRIEGHRAETETERETETGDRNGDRSSS